MSIKLGFVEVDIGNRENLVRGWGRRDRCPGPVKDCRVGNGRSRIHLGADRQDDQRKILLICDLCLSCMLGGTGPASVQQPGAGLPVNRELSLDVDRTITGITVDNETSPD